MKKLLVLLIGVVVVSSCNLRNSRNNGAEVTSVRHVRPFDRVEIKGLCDVIFTQGDNFGVKVVGPEALVKQLKTHFSGTTLTIGNDKGVERLRLNGRRNRTTVYISSPDLVGVRLLGMGDFTVAGPLDTDTLNVYLQGMGDMEMENVICDAFNVTLHGMGDIDVHSLTAARSDIRLKGMGDINIEFRSSGHADCSVVGVGEIELSGTLKTLQKQVRGTGSIDVDDLFLSR